MDRRNGGPLDRAATVLETVLAIAFLCIVVLNFANVVGRYGFGRELTGADEVQVYVLICITFVGAAVTSARGQHLRMDLIRNRLPPRIGRAVVVLELVVATVISGFVAWHSIRYALQIVAIDRRSDIANIPMGIPHGAVALGLSAIALIALFALLAAVFAGRRASRRVSNDGQAQRP